MSDAGRTPPDLAGIPPDPGGPVFAAPWEAQAFAMVVLLQERGLFSRAEWTAVLADEIGRAQASGDADLGDTYYRHWLAALERITAEKGAADPSRLARCRTAWTRAAARTPHGAPITLAEADFRPDPSPPAAPEP